MVKLYLLSVQPKADSRNCLRYLSKQSLNRMPVGCQCDSPRRKGRKRNDAKNCVMPSALLPSPIMLFSSLSKDKLKYIKIFLSLSEQKSELGSAKLEVVKSIPPTGARGKTFIEKSQRQSKEAI